MSKCGDRTCCKWENRKVGGERRQTVDHWSCAICLGPDRVRCCEAVRAKAVPVHDNVDKLQLVASGNWPNARASNGKWQELGGWLAGTAWILLWRMVTAAAVRKN
jgi:hypothetical protein